MTLLCTKGQGSTHQNEAHKGKPKEILRKYKNELGGTHLVSDLSVSLFIFFKLSFKGAEKQFSCYGSKYQFIRLTGFWACPVGMI